MVDDGRLANMTESLFNQVWYSVAELKIQLRQHVEIHRHIYRGERHYILQDNVTGQCHRFTPQAYQIIGLMNGERTLQTIWEIACDRLGDDMPTQNDIISLCSKLYRTNAIQSDKRPAIEDIEERRRQHDRKQLMMKFKMPLSIRVPLLDPERFLAATSPWVAPLIGKTGGAVWLLLVLYGFLQLLVYWREISANTADQVLALENIVLITLVYPVVKALHELGHAYCVKKWGGEVHEIGVIFLIFFPVPYVDATAATVFPNKYHRMLVGAAGIMTEAAIAAGAMIIWTHLEEGVLRAVMFNVMLISGVSTVLFNGNPLLRFDAYYVLSDFLEIPNLGARSNNYVGFLVKRYLFGAEELASPARSWREATWLTGYSLCAFGYRIVITVAITLFFASKYFIFGTIIGLWFIYISIISPTLKMIVKSVTDPALKPVRTRILFVGVVLSTVLAVLLFAVPLPLSTSAQGVPWVGERSFVRSEASGFVLAVRTRSGQRLDVGDVMIELENSELRTDVEVLHHQVREAQERYQASLADRSASKVIKQEIEYIEEEYKRSLEKISQLQMRAQQRGYIEIFDEGNLLGQYVRRGQVLGYIVDGDSLPVSVMVLEDHIELVEYDTQGVELRYASNPNQLWKGNVRRIAPSPSNELVSPVLSIEGGGAIALDPAAVRDPSTFQRYYRVEIDVPEGVESRIDERVHVVFRHAPEPVAKRLYRAVRQSFLKYFDA
jgi:putative peptide zinc metalloprotease protein